MDASGMGEDWQWRTGRGGLAVEDREWRTNGAARKSPASKGPGTGKGAHRGTGSSQEVAAPHDWRTTSVGWRVTVVGARSGVARRSSKSRAARRPISYPG